MATYLSPGVYTREIDFSFYVKQISTSSCGMVGVAERGPINKPMLVTSWEQFINKFGSYLQAGYLAYAARAFFDNGGSVLYVNRIAHLSDPTDKNSLTAVKSSVTLKDRRAVAAVLETGTAGTDRITWLARQAGVGGNGITVELVASGTDTPLSVDVTGQAITVNLATDSAGDPASTADQVVAAIAAKSEADALVQTSSEDTGVVQPAAAANLAGGQDAQEPSAYPQRMKASGEIASASRSKTDRSIRRERSISWSATRMMSWRSSKTCPWTRPLRTMSSWPSTNVPISSLSRTWGRRPDRLTTVLQPASSVCPAETTD